MFRIKICGITTPEDGLAAVDAGADAIGLNFCPASPRCITIPQAKEIVRNTRVPTEWVGVFVNATPSQIAAISSEVGLSWIQLHGDERPEMLAELDTELPIIRVRPLDGRGLEAIADDIGACERAGRRPSAVLLDARSPGEYGGSGKTICWDALVRYEARLGDLPLILAGGLKPENVAEAICQVGPAAVDTASGVEARPGHKDPEKMRSFVIAANKAWERRMTD